MLYEPNVITDIIVVFLEAHSDLLLVRKCEHALKAYHSYSIHLFLLLYSEHEYSSNNILILFAGRSFDVFMEMRNQWNKAVKVGQQRSNKSTL